MKKVFKFVKGKKEEKRESGVTPSQSADIISPAQTPDDEKFLGLDGSSGVGYIVDFSGKDKSLTKLHKAAWQGNLEKLKSALKKVDVDSVDKRNRTALHFAVAQGHPNIVWFLLGNNASTSVSDDEGHTPLLKAIECGHKECANLLLDRGADVNATDCLGNSGLHVAVGQASPDTVSSLLKRGANTEIANNAGDFPLHVATRMENVELIDLLLNSQASVDVLDRENRTPLMLASKAGNLLLVQLLLEHGAQSTIVDCNGWTARDYAMLGGYEEAAALLKSLSKKTDTKTKGQREGSGSALDEENTKKEISPLAMTDETTKKFNESFSKNNALLGDKEKTEDFADSPEAEVIPPFCQPPRSWEMIQAGMIDGKDDGSEPKRRSITTLGTLHSRRESFTENLSSSPRFTLSLNRRKTSKNSKAFARQRFSFNEEESLKCWLNEEKLIRKDLEKIELENMLNLEDEADSKSGPSRSPAVSDWDSASAENSQDRGKFVHLEPDENFGHSLKTGDTSSGTDTLGREGTMRGVELLIVNSGLTTAQASENLRPNSWDSEDAGSEKEENFPPPPTALELGVDMAKSIKYMKGLSVDQTSEGTLDRNTWKNFYESHSLDRLEERDLVETSRKNDSFPLTKTEEACHGQKPKDRFTDVSKRINEQLECYDQALRELAESEKAPPQNYHSLPIFKTGAAGDNKRTSSQELIGIPHLEPHSLPICPTRSAGSCDSSPETLSKLVPADFGEKPEKKTKRQMLLAMRDVKHAVHLAGTFKTSMDDHLLSPLTNPERGFNLEEARSSRSSRSDSPPDENPFFGVERQETVLNRNEMGRKSSSSGTGEESTLWLQDEKKKKECGSAMSDDDVPEILADEGPEHLRNSSFSPLGEIQREMEEESRGTECNRSLAQNNVGVRDHLHGGENEEVFREPSPDVSLSSGPLEPIGAEKDSGSDPESSHNEPSPSHRYNLKSQHDWLKSHLRMATSEKSKLEELTVQLSEKAERLQYELADAKEAAKSRDEVIRLLQDQLARMEAAYTKSLEESVQSRLQLTSYEQEILHLKELCFRYEEEKEVYSSAAGGPDDGLRQELQSRVKILEEDKGKLQKELMRLEEEKCLLEKRIRLGKKEEKDMIEQCERWKERCKKLEDACKAKDSEQIVCESRAKEKGRDLEESQKRLREENLKLEHKCLEARENNIELKFRIDRLTAELEAERDKTKSHLETLELVAELKKKNSQLEFKLREAEKEIQENMVKKLKEKEEEMRGLVKQFNQERDSLVASYERKLTDGTSEGNSAYSGQEIRNLKQMIKTVQNGGFQEHLSAEGAKVQLSSYEKANLATKTNCGYSDVLLEEMTQLKRKLEELEKEMAKEKGENATEVKSEIRELKVEVNSLRELVGCESGKRRRREAGKEDELAWSSLYGMKASRRRRDARSASVVAFIADGAERDSEEFFIGRKNLEAPEQNILLRPCETTKDREETNKGTEKLEFLEIKKEILNLQSKMSDEKNLRHALENQMIKLNLDFNEKGSLEREINSLKKKVELEGLRRSELELVEFQKHLEAKREKYIADQESSRKEPSPDDYKVKCEILARERDKVKKMRNNFGRRTKSFDPPATGEMFGPSRSRPLYFQHRFLALDPDIKNKLEDELNRSIRKYVGECSSAPSVSNVQRDFVNKNIFN